MGFEKQDDWAWKESGDDWSNFGVVCCLCGEKLYGGTEKAILQCAAHSQVEHEGETLEYAVFATPLSREAKKRAHSMTTATEAVTLTRIRRDHGTGWYFYALHYGTGVALDHLRQIEQMGDERPATLRERVQKKRAK